MKKNKRMIGTSIVSIIGIIFCLSLLLFISWLFMESVSARLRMSFESEPSEGYSYWYWKEFRRQLPEAICYSLPILLALVFAIRGFIKSIRSKP